jgi:8-oxo-dGTP diphosphatase
MPRMHSRSVGGVGGGTRVVAAVIRRADELLVCQRPPHKRHGGLWEFPGGKCETGEADACALRRELREELGLEVLDVGRVEFEAHDEGSPYIIVFVSVRVVGDPFCYEHTALRWGTVDEIGRLPLAPSDRRFVAHLQKGMRG